MNTDLLKLDPLGIAKITDVGELAAKKEKADIAAAIYKAQDEWENSQKCKEIALRYVRQAGIVLLPPDQGGMTPREPYRGGVPSHKEISLPTPYQQQLENAGLSPATGDRWQKLARIPEDKFEAYFPEAEYSNEEFTIAGLMKFAGEWYGRSDIAEWSTPQWLFDVLDREFHFTLDVCARSENAKCEKYFSKKDNGLAQSWEGVCWMNPPYGREIEAWMAKAKTEARKGAVVVCLVPARPDTNWWWNNVLDGEIRFIRGRIKFSSNDTAAPFPSVVIVLGAENKGKVVWWDVQSQQPRS